MKKLFRFSRIQSRITVFFSIVVLGTIVIFIIMSYRFSFLAIRDNSVSYTQQLVRQVKDNIDYYITYMYDISQIISYNSDVQQYLLGDASRVSYQNEYLRKRVEEVLNNTSSTRKDIANVIIIGNNGASVLNKNNILNKYNDPKLQSWYKETLSAKGVPVVSSSHVQNIVYNTYSYVVSLSRVLYDDTTGKELGVLLVDLNYSVIKNMCKNISLGKRGYIFIVDKNGDIVYHPQQQLIYSGLKKEYIDDVLKVQKGEFTVDDGANSRIYTINESENSLWRVVGVTYIDDLVPNNQDLQAYYLGGASVSILTAFAISYYIARRISRPIKQLENSMTEVKNGNFDTKISVDNTDEIGHLSDNFNIMIQTIKFLIEENKRENELKRENEFKTLQSQINPHFLYNTLDSIIWMAEMGNNDEVVEMTSALSKLFRISISRESDIITIGNEIDYINSYLTIQKMRYKDKLAAQFDISGEILNNYTLKLILQPIVENSIYHGIKNKELGGAILIKGYKEDDKIIIKIIDDGVGMSQEELLDIFEYKPERTGSTGVGINNVNQRIKMYFGEQYGITFESKLQSGTTATVTLPILNEGDIDEYKKI